MKINNNILLLLMLALSVMITGCKDDIDLTLPEEVDVTLEGRAGYILAAENTTSFVPLDTATAQIGSVTVSADVDGKFAFSKAPVGDQVLVVSADGYFTQYKPVTIEENGTVDFGDTTLIAAQTFTMDATTGGQFSTTDDLASVKFDADVIVDEQGNPYTGTVTVKANAITPSSRGFFDSFPGDFSGLTTSGDTVDIISFGVIAVELFDDENNPLSIADGETAEIRIKVVDAAGAPQTLPLWYLDEETGQWTEEGVATLDDDEYVGTVSHFSWWNFDYPSPTGSAGLYGYTNIAITVVDEMGNPVDNADVSLRSAAGFAWTTRGVTDVNGRVNIDVYVLSSAANPYYIGSASKGNLFSDSSEIAFTRGRGDGYQMQLTLKDPEPTLTVNARSVGLGVNRTLNHDGSALRFGNGSSAARYNITLSNDSVVDGLQIDNIIIPNGNGFTTLFASNAITTLDAGDARTFRLTYSSVQLLVDDQMIIQYTVNGIAKEYRIRLEAGTDLASPITETVIIGREMAYIGYINKEAGGRLDPNNDANTTDSPVAETTTQGQRTVFAMDVNSIPAGVTVSAVRLSIVSGDHAGLNLYQGNQSEVLAGADYEPFNQVNLVNTAIAVTDTQVSLNTDAINYIQQVIDGSADTAGKKVAKFLLSSPPAVDISFGYVDLTSVRLEVVYQ